MNGKELNFLRVRSSRKSRWITFNVPEPGYAECTACGQPGMADGLCDQCLKKLEYLEKEGGKKK